MGLYKLYITKKVFEQIYLQLFFWFPFNYLLEIKPAEVKAFKSSFLTSMSFNSEEFLRAITTMSKESSIELLTDLNVSRTRRFILLRTTAFLSILVETVIPRRVGPPLGRFRY